jgi:hypothetical protein
LNKRGSEEFLHEHQIDHGVIRRNEERFIDICVSFENDFRVSGTSLGLEVGVWWAERKRLNLLLISSSYVPAYVLDGVLSLDPAS